MKPIEGYYFRIYDNTIFYVKGVIQPQDKVVGYPKYVPSPIGDRIDNRGIRYYKEPSITEEIRLVEEKYRKYLVYDPYIGNLVPEIPYKDIEFIYNPIEKALQVMNTKPKNKVLEDTRHMLIDLKNSANVKNIGISGSILVNLYRDSSDIDIVVYGEKEGLSVYDYLKEVIDKETSPYRRYSKEDIIRLYEFRKRETPIKFNELVQHAKRRVLEGYFGKREYFIRLVKTPLPDEDYGKVVYKKIGKATMKFKVVDAREAIFTPCKYVVEVLEHIEGVKIGVDEIYSIRGRFNELAFEDEIVIARGTVERLEYANGDIKYRLYLGDPGDYMTNISLAK